jgi:hypothetical protein
VSEAYFTSVMLHTPFLVLEQERVDRINFSKLAHLQKDMVDDSIEQVSNSQSLFSHFKNTFDSETALDKVRIIYS